MTIHITGRHMDTGDALRAHVETRLDEAVHKYFDHATDINVTFSKQGHSFEAACALHLDSGLYIHASGMDSDVYACFEQSVGKIEKQLRRYKRRLKSHSDQLRLNDAIMQAPEKIFAPETNESEDELPEAFTPVIVAETHRRVPHLSMAEAVMQLEVGEEDVVLFKSRMNDALNLVYKRADKNIGWLELQEKQDA